MIGEIIKDFKLTGKLGTGGMGEVWVGEQQIIKTKVAIKLLPAHVSGDAQQVQRFFNEALAAGKIKHAGIVKIFDVGFHAGRAFLIMELLEGETLASRIARAHRLGLGPIADVGKQIASVLQATHAAGVIHRDLKPDNIFLVSDAELASGERVKILDFGIAKLGTTGITGTGNSMGTPSYMAPEQWNDAAKADARADIYSLGCVAFQMCCGRPPFVASSIGEACSKHLTETPPRASSLADIPRELDDLIAQMLAKRADDRPTLHTIGGVFAALAVGQARPFDPTLPPGPSPSPVRGAVHDTTLGAAAASADVARPPRKRGGLIVGLGAVVVAGGIGGTYVLTHRSTTAVQRAHTAHAPGGCPTGMVYVAPGSFFMGSADGEGGPDERPRHKVTLSAYCIDKTEVTVAAYGACVAGGGCPAVPVTVNVQDFSADDTKLWSQFCNGSRGDRQSYPVNCVDWEQANTYCEWAAKRLPTEAEWEHAARGSDGRTYPWGNDPPTAKKLNACGGECRELGKRLGKTFDVMYDDSDGFEATAPVASYPDGASPVGALDLAGNVWEWVADWYGPYSGDAQTDPAGPASGAQRINRGGGWGGAVAGNARAAFRDRRDPSHRGYSLGFRCAD